MDDPEEKEKENETEKDINNKVNNFKHDKQAYLILSCHNNTDNDNNK